MIRHLRVVWVVVMGFAGSVVITVASCTEPVSSTALVQGISETRLQFELIDDVPEGPVFGQVRVRKGNADVRLERGEYFRLNGQRLVRGSGWFIERLEARIPVADEYALEFFDGETASKATISGIPRFELSDVELVRDEDGQWAVRGETPPSPSRFDFSQRVELVQDLGEAGRVRVVATARGSAEGFQLQLPNPSTAPEGQQFVPGKAALTVTRTLQVPAFQMSGFSSARATVRIVREISVTIPDLKDAAEVNHVEVSEHPSLSDLVEMINSGEFDRVRAGADAGSMAVASCSIVGSARMREIEPWARPGGADWLIMAGSLGESLRILGRCDSLDVTSWEIATIMVTAGERS